MDALRSINKQVHFYGISSSSAAYHLICAIEKFYQNGFVIDEEIINLYKARFDTLSYDEEDVKAYVYETLDAVIKFLIKQEANHFFRDSEEKKLPRSHISVETMELLASFDERLDHERNINSPHIKRVIEVVHQSLYYDRLASGYIEVLVDQDDPNGTIVNKQYDATGFQSEVPVDFANTVKEDLKYYCEVIEKRGCLLTPSSYQRKGPFWDWLKTVFLLYPLHSPYWKPEMKLLSTQNLIVAMENDPGYSNSDTILIEDCTVNTKHCSNLSILGSILYCADIKYIQDKFKINPIGKNHTESSCLMYAFR